jgi:hypothetical protein
MWWSSPSASDIARSPLNYHCRTLGEVKILTENTLTSVPYRILIYGPLSNSCSRSLTFSFSTVILPGLSITVKARLETKLLSAHVCGYLLFVSTAS